jgi:hypothetical protein
VDWLKKFTRFCNGRRLLAALLVIASLCALAGCDLDAIAPERGGREPKVKFESCGEELTLSLFKGTSAHKQYKIPDEVDGKPVTALKSFAFSNSEYLQEISIGAGIVEIDSWSLTNCKELKAIKVSMDNPAYKDIDGVLYTKDGKTLVAFPNKNTEHLSLPIGVEEIADNAFYKCTNIKTVDFPEGLKTIGARAFLKCKGLEKADLPDSLEVIGDDAFSFCHSLTYVYIPASIKTVGNFAFFDAEKLGAIKIARAEDDSELILGKDWKRRKDANINADVPVEWGG